MITVSDLLFKRIGSIHIGQDNNTGIVLRDFHFTFSVTKTSTSDDKNKAIITIDNLTNETRNKIQVKDGNILILKLGYGNDEDEKTVFLGDIAKVIHIDNGTTHQTKIEVVDGINIDNEQSSISFADKVNVKDVLKETLQNLSLPTKNPSIIENITDIFLNNGFAFQGNSTNLITKLSNVLDIDWTIQEKEIRLKLKEKLSSDKIGVYLSPYNGLIASPIRLAELDKERTKKKNTDKNKAQHKEPIFFYGWEVKSLLLPTINPNDYIKIKCAKILDGAEFLVDEVKHNGDNYSGDFSTTLKVKDVDYE